MISVDFFDRFLIWHNSIARNLPHVIFESCEKCTEIIKLQMDCRLGIWPNTPRFNKHGVLDPLDFDVETDEEWLREIWREWGNQYNQDYIQECFGRYRGVFDTSCSILVDTNVDVMALDKCWQRMHAHEEAILNSPSEILEIVKWFIIHIYESDSFIFLAEDALRKSADIIKCRFAEMDINFLSLDPVQK
jgi:hypothetical protein